MADTQDDASSMFRQSALSRISNADDLDNYIKVTNPSAWVVLGAALFLVCGLVVWSLTAIIPSTTTVTGIANGNKVTCWLDAKTFEKMGERGLQATVLGKKVVDSSFDSIPQSGVEVKKSLERDYYGEALGLHDWNYELQLLLSESVTGAESETTLVPVSITVSETHPLDLVFGKR